MGSLRNRLVLVLVGLAGLAGPASAQRLTVEAVKLEVPPTIDGVLAEGEWSQAKRVTGFVDQMTGKPTEEQTEGWIGLGEKGIYVAVYCHDTKPEGIVARTIQRGSQFEGEDYCGLVIDPLNRREFQGNSQFFVNALGTQFDRIAGGRAAKREWRGEWQAACKRVDDGFIVELYVPWEILSTPSGTTGDCLVNIARFHERTKTASYWSDLGNPMLSANHGTLTGVPFPKRDDKPRVETLGYVSPEYDKDASPQSTLRAGVDLRYRPTRQTTGVLSINPDFKNIEGDIAGIEFTRSERFLEDTRPFFTEGNQYFRLSYMFSLGTLFYSPRIDDFDTGFKFFGDLTKQDQVGLLATREDGTKGDAVFRYRRQLGSNSEVAVYSTARSHPGARNTLFGTNGTYENGSWGGQWDLAFSDDLVGKGTAAGLGVFYQAPFLFTVVQATSFSPNFRAGLGLVPFTDRRGAYWYTEYNRQYRKGQIRSVRSELFLEDNKKFSGENQARGGNFVLNFQTRSDWMFSLNASSDRFETEESKSLALGVTWNVSNPRRQLSLRYERGEIAGDPSSFVSFGGSFRLAKGFDVSLRHSLFRLNGETDQTVFTAGWEIDPFQSVTARAVQRDGDLNWYLAYRKAGGKGMEYYLIVGDPNARRSHERIAFKLVWAG